MISRSQSQKLLLTPGLYDNLICVQRVWKALCPIRSMQRISTCPWQRWSGSFRRRCGAEPVQRAQILQVEQAEINEHHKPHWFNTRWHRMNIPRVQPFPGVFQLPKQTHSKKKTHWWKFQLMEILHFGNNNSKLYIISLASVVSFFVCLRPYLFLLY